MFQGGVEDLAAAGPGGRALALDAFVEGALKMVRWLSVAAPGARELLVSGRALDQPEVWERLEKPLGAMAPVRQLRGFARDGQDGSAGRSHHGGRTGRLAGKP